jgi:malate dehydrogenase (oxaloacetate-decarboxylating)
MGIPIGKLALYTAAAGIHPALTLPVSLDVGTDNAALLADDLYIGWRQARLRGPEYDSLVDEFVRAVKTVFPRAVLQWEDFKKANAVRLLEAYRRVLPSFNDDIQGTAAMALGVILAAERVTRTPLARERIVIVGGGAAGLGIAHLLREALREAGLQGDDLIRALAVVDREGLLVDDVPIADPDQRAFAWPPAVAARSGIGTGKARDLEAVVRALRATVMVGASGQPGAFTRGAVEAMAAQIRRPVILPLSNPNACSEATPADLMAWTDGRALVAAGSPFPDVTLGRRRRRSIAQANNAFVFPSIGLAAVAGELTEVTSGMFRSAAEALAREVTEDQLRAGRLLPRVRDLRAVTARMAAAILRDVRRTGRPLPFAERETESAVAASMWEPRYAELVPVDERGTVPPAGAHRPRAR